MLHCMVLLTAPYTVMFPILFCTVLHSSMELQRRSQSMCRSHQRWNLSELGSRCGFMERVRQHSAECCGFSPGIQFLPTCRDCWETETGQSLNNRSTVVAMLCDQQWVIRWQPESPLVILQLDHVELRFSCNSAHLSAARKDCKAPPPRHILTVLIPHILTVLIS